MPAADAQPFQKDRSARLLNFHKCTPCRYHDGVIANVKAFESDLDDARHCRVPYCQGMSAAPPVRVLYLMCKVSVKATIVCQAPGVMPARALTICKSRGATVSESYVS